MMGMSSYEVVRRAIEFENPERLPLRFEALGLSDVHCVNWKQVCSGADTKLHETIDEWGCLWMRSGVTNIGQVKGHPLADWSSLEHFRWPNPDDPALYDVMEDRFTGSNDKYIMTGIFMLLFERMYALHGFENTLADLYLERKNIENLADRIVEFNLRVVENISQRFPNSIHGLHFIDDWGTEQATFIKPELWNEFFRPRYARIFNAIHRAGRHVWMHSCGKINAITENLIEIGLDVINLQQPRTLGVTDIGRQFQGRICFSSLCDIQHTLPFKRAKVSR